MIAAIRISGLIDLSEKQKSSLDSLNLRRKYNCILLKKDETYRLNNVKDLLSFGEVSDSTLKSLISKRAKTEKGKNKVENAEDVLKNLNGGKRLKELGLKPYLQLHPPIGGFKKSTKLPYPRGVLGENKKIEELIKRMI